MKQNIKFFILLIALVVTSAIIPKQVKAQQSYISFQTFYDELSPYGQWVDYPKYGYVWIPDVGSDFEPYSTDGRWVMTDYGWTWVSDYEWGWAPFHYGRWDYDNYYGWLWVPDNQWGPSWVTWVRSDGYYGWQPMQPGISISLSFGRDYRTNFDHWTFVRDRDFERSDIQRYYVNQSDQHTIIRNSSVINNTYNDRTRNTTYISGPKRDDVQRVTGTRIKSVAIQENNRPGQNLSNNRLSIYRPEIKRNTENGHQSAPTRVVNLKDVKQASERNSSNKSQKVNSNDNNKRQQQAQPQQQQKQQQPQRQQQQQQQDRQQKQVQPQQQQKQQQQQQRQQQLQQDRQQKQQQQLQQKQQSQQKQQQDRQQKQQQQAQPQQQQPQRQQQQQDRQQKQQQAQPQQQQQQQNATPPTNNRREQRQNAAKTQERKRNKQATETKTDETKKRER